MIKFLDKKISNFIKNKQAISMPVLAIMALSAVAMTGTAIDVNRYTQLSMQLQALADQSVLSGATFDTATRRAENCKGRFESGLTQKDLINSTSIYKLVCNEDAQGDLRITADVNIKTYFSSALGLDNMDVSVTAVASRPKNDAEIVYVFSAQGTLCATTTRSAGSGGKNTVAITPDPTCQKFLDIKNAMKSSIAELRRKFFDPSKLRIGVVPYTYKVKFPDTSQIPPSLLALETTPNYFSDFSDIPPVLPSGNLSLPDIIPLTSGDAANAAALENTIDKMELSISSPPWGRTDLGIHTAALMLDPAHKQFFKNHTVNTYDNSNKYVVLMSDGINTGCCYTNYPAGNYDNQYLYSFTPYNEHTLRVCKELKEQGVTIFTLLFNVDINDTGADIINNVMARCASGEYAVPEDEQDPNKMLACKDKYACYNIANPKDFDNAFEEMVLAISKASLDQ